MYEFSFEKLQVWQTSRKLIKRIYIITIGFPADERFGLINQLRRAAISVSSNLAEGSARKTGKDQAHFTTLAYSSLMELLNLLILSNDLGYLEDQDLQELRAEIQTFSVKINALRNSQINKE